jgi:hypothetical protein
MRVDIGIFDYDHLDTPGREILKNNQFNVSEEDVNAIISRLDANLHAGFTIINVRRGFDDRKLRLLCEFAD